METVFDYNITKKEKESIGCSGFTKEMYLKYVDKDAANWELGNLFLQRGDLEKAKAYADRLPSYMKQDWYRIKGHIPEYNVQLSGNTTFVCV